MTLGGKLGRGAEIMYVGMWFENSFDGEQETIRYRKGYFPGSDLFPLT
jgi:hypothetical protein